MSTIAEQITDWCLALRYDALPDAVVHEVKRRIIDSAGCAMGAWSNPPARIARQWATEAEVAHGARVWGTTKSVVTDRAAFANGVSVRYLDCNDTYLSKEPAHPSDNIPAILAAAEQAKVGGREVITAIVAAYEIQCRLCDAASIRARGWDHVTYGAFSTAAGVAMVWGLDAEQFGHALAIAGTANTAVRQTRAGELSMWKGCAFANTARNGVVAADLARRGMTGPSEIFEGVMGFCKQVSGPLDGFVLGDASRGYKILDCHIKYWPAEDHSQSAIDAALKLRPDVGDVSMIERIDIDSFDAAVDIIGSDPEKWAPTSRETADHSLPYCTVVALVDGDVTPAQFSHERINDPDLRALVKKVSVHRDDALSAEYPQRIPNRVRITLAGGKELSELVASPPGHAQNPMTDDQVITKFRSFAEPMLSAGAVERILQTVWSFDELSDVSEWSAPLAELNDRA